MFKSKIKLSSNKFQKYSISTNPLFCKSYHKPNNWVEKLETSEKKQDNENDSNIHEKFLQSNIKIIKEKKKILSDDDWQPFKNVYRNEKIE